MKDTKQIIAIAIALAVTMVIELFIAGMVKLLDSGKPQPAAQSIAAPSVATSAPADKPRTPTPDTTNWHTMTNDEIIAETAKCARAGLGTQSYTDELASNRIVYVECNPMTTPNQ